MSCLLSRVPERRWKTVPRMSCDVMAWIVFTSCLLSTHGDVGRPNGTVTVLQDSGLMIEVFLTLVALMPMHTTGASWVIRCY